jgi:hypothetical protein
VKSGTAFPSPSPFSNEGVNTFDAIMDEPNQQTLKHHAEDMVAAGHAILKLLGKEVQATPQPKEGIMYE